MRYLAQIQLSPILLVRIQIKLHTTSPRRVLSMKKIIRYFKLVDANFRLNLQITATLIPYLFLALLILNTFLPLLLFSPGQEYLSVAAGLSKPIIAFLLVILWLPQLMAAFINAAFFNQGITKIPVRLNKELRIWLEKGGDKSLQIGKSYRLGISIDSPAEEDWGKESEAELLLVLKSNAGIRPLSQSYFLYKKESSTPAYFQVWIQEPKELICELSTYLVSPTRQITLLSTQRASIDKNRINNSKAKTG